MWHSSLLTPQTSGISNLFPFCMSLPILDILCVESCKICFWLILWDTSRVHQCCNTYQGFTQVGETSEQLRTHTALQWTYILFPEPTWGCSQPPVSPVWGHPDTSGFYGYLHTHTHTQLRTKKIFKKKKKGLRFLLNLLTDENSMIWVCKALFIRSRIGQCFRCSLLGVVNGTAVAIELRITVWVPSPCPGITCLGLELLW